jgi:hypothetical protein
VGHYNSSSAGFCLEATPQIKKKGGG